VDGRAYFGKCPTVTMFSWGGNWLYLVYGAKMP
jgi:hypothetical protein